MTTNGSRQNEAGESEATEQFEPTLKEVERVTIGDRHPQHKFLYVHSLNLDGSVAAWASDGATCDFNDLELVRPAVYDGKKLVKPALYH